MSSKQPPSDMFLRRIEIPPGAPWHQHRAARIEALHGGPLTSAAANVSVRRLGRWSPGAPGRFAAAYVRAAQFYPAEVETVVDGVPVKFRFVRAKAVQADLRELGVTGLYVVLAALCLVLALQKGLTASAANDETLSREEIRARHWSLAESRSDQEAKEQALLKRAGAEERSFADLAADLAWLGRAKTPSAIIERVRWTGTDMLVLSDGPGPPLIASEGTLTPVRDVAGAREWAVKRGVPGVIKTGAVQAASPGVPANAGLSRPHVVP